MSGTKQTMLCGYVIPAQFNKNLDHTYVASGSGFAWGCWGRNSGGQLLTEGNGDERLAVCLASKMGRADIWYGAIGLCHQAANRILYACSRTVHAARGYPASLFAYGHFGLGYWNRLSVCLGQHSAATSEFAPTTEEDQPEMPDEPEIDSEQAFSLIAKEFSEYIESKGVLISPGELSRVALIQRKLFDARQDVWKKYNEAHISNDDLLERLQEIMFESLRSTQEVLGYGRFKEIFGGDPGNLSNIYDPAELRKVPPLR